MATASKLRATGEIPRQNARCHRGKEKEAQIRTPEFNGHGFLRHSFLPLTDKQHKELKQVRKIEREFFNSLSNLATLYAFQSLSVQGRVFPYNILLAYRHAALRLKEISPDLQLSIIQDTQHAACLATVKSINTGATLYYIAVRPLYEMLQDKYNKQSGELLLSVYSYLYQVAGIPYYRDNSSYMYYTYQMMEEWVKENPADWEEDDFKTQVSCLNRVYRYGDIMQRKIRSPYNLQLFESRVSHYRPVSAWDVSLYELSQKFLNLYKDFPSRSIMDNIHIGMIEPWKEERVYPDQYISFYWDYDDCMYQSLFEAVNSELQEKEITEEPLSIQLFDKPQEKPHPQELEFETRFFELLHELNSLL